MRADVCMDTRVEELTGARGDGSERRETREISTTNSCYFVDWALTLSRFWKKRCGAAQEDKATRIHQATEEFHQRFCAFTFAFI